MIILILILIFLLFLFLSKKYKINKNKKINDKNDYTNDYKTNNNFDDITDNTNNVQLYNTNTNIDLLPFFFDNKYHQDYVDTINTITQLVPNQKSLFNLANSPLMNVVKPKDHEMNIIIGKFIDEFNNNNYDIQKTNPANKNWNSNYLSHKYDNGWKRQMEKIDMPEIYNDPAKPALLKLVKIMGGLKEETEFEIRYTIHFVAQKENVRDQIVLKIQFHMSKDNVDFKNFFNSNINADERELIVAIEDIYVTGFLTVNGNTKANFDVIFDHSNSNYDGRIISDQLILEELNKKKLDYEKEMVNIGY